MNQITFHQAYAVSSVHSTETRDSDLKVFKGIRSQVYLIMLIFPIITLLGIYSTSTISGISETSASSTKNYNLEVSETSEFGITNMSFLQHFFKQKCILVKLHSYKATTTLQYFSTFLCAILNDRKLSLYLKDVRNVQIFEDLKYVICILQAAVRQNKALQNTTNCETPTYSLLRVSKFWDC